MTAKQVIDKALAEVGVKESPPNSNNVKYNTYYYGKPVSGASYPWCCTFVWWILSSCGIKVPKTASCMTMGQWFKDNGRWFTSPQVGDLVFFHYKTNSRWTNHVGIVAEVKGNEIRTIEGNTSINSDDNGGCVQVRKRSSNIVGYGRPSYDNVGTPSNIKPVLMRGSTGSFVSAWQTYLKSCNIDCGAIDGVFGKLTEQAVKEYQKIKHLPVTGVIDKDDWESVGK